MKAENVIKHLNKGKKLFWFYNDQIYSIDKTIIDKIELTINSEDCLIFYNNGRQIGSNRLFTNDRAAIDSYFQIERNKIQNRIKELEERIQRLEKRDV